MVTSDRLRGLASIAAARTSSSSLGIHNFISAMQFRANYAFTSISLGDLGSHATQLVARNLSATLESAWR
jgi:hypothetical protein